MTILISGGKKKGGGEAGEGEKACTLTAGRLQFNQFSHQFR